MLDASPNGVLLLDSTGRIRYSNRRAAELFGYDVEELAGHSIDALMVNTAGGPDALRAEILGTRTARPMAGSDHVLGRRRDGSTFPFELSLTPMESDDEPWIFAVLVDVTRRVESEARAARVTRIWRTLAEAHQAIIRAGDPYAMSQEICRIVVETGGYLGAWTGAPDQTGRMRATGQAGSLAEYIATAPITTDAGDPWGSGPIARTYREGRPYYVGDFSADPRLAPWHVLGARYGIRAVATLPMRVGLAGETRGVLTLYSATADVFDREMRTLLESLADNMSQAFGAFRSRRDLQLAVTHRSELLDRLAAATERERAAIAADIHDDSVQVLAAVDLRLGALKRRVHELAPELDEHVAQTQETLADAVERLRALLFDLEPVDADLALPDALEDLAGQVFAGSPVRPAVTGEPTADLAPAERRQAVRVAKEALTNVRRHAGATAVTIELTTRERGVEIAVSDDGVGVSDPSAASPPGHRGLTTMRDRAELAGGWLRIERRDEGGTTVRSWYPDTRAD
jgi:PAS domain S-box-containing protein